MDMEFNKLIEHMPDVVINTTAAREHVGDIELAIKDWAQSVVSVGHSQL